MNNQDKEYVDRLLMLKSSCKLLEDIESRKEAENHKLTADNKQLEEQLLQV
jgi:cell division protein FtsB